jgi:SAM-dependent methyltransferase
VQLDIETIRRAELEPVRSYFQPGTSVLEVGGGNGYQASVLRSWGCTVLSVDVRIANDSRYHPVAIYDGWQLPARTGSFDIVYSSNVLEHVEPGSQLPALLEELRASVKPGGVLIHALPTATWRLWTSLSHYAFVVKYAAGLRSAQGEDGPVSTRIARRGVLQMAKRALLAGPHGEYPSALSELWYFSRRRWMRLFEEQGFTDINARPARLYYSGYITFPRLPVRVRRQLARVLGSSTDIFIMRT